MVRVRVRVRILNVLNDKVLLDIIPADIAWIYYIKIFFFGLKAVTTAAWTVGEKKLNSNVNFKRMLNVQEISIFHERHPDEYIPCVKTIIWILHGRSLENMWWRSFTWGITRWIVVVGIKFTTNTLRHGSGDDEVLLGCSGGGTNESKYRLLLRTKMVYCNENGKCSL